METANIATEQSQYLTFFIAGEEYAIGVLRVKEIIEYDTLTKLPSTPPSVRGVINLRGSVVPVMDLALKFGLPECKVTKLTCIVIVEVERNGEKAVMGIMTDSVSQVVELTPENVEKVPAFGTKAPLDFLQGMGKAGKKFVLILDIDKTLSAADVQAAASLEGAEADTEGRTVREGVASGLPA